MERGRRTISDVTMPTLQYRGNAYQPPVANRSQQLRYDRSTFIARQETVRECDGLTYRGCPYVPVETPISSGTFSLTYRGVRYER